MLLGYIMHTTTCSQCKVDSEIKHINKRATKYTLVFPCCFMRIYLSLLTFLASCFLHGLLITKYVSLSNFLFEGFPWGSKLEKLETGNTQKWLLAYRNLGYLYLFAVGFSCIFVFKWEDWKRLRILLFWYNHEVSVERLWNLSFHLVTVAV